MAGAALLLALLSASPLAARPPTGALLGAHCREGAADPHNPWALAHGIAFEGRAFKARDGRPAPRVLVSEFLHRDVPGAPPRFDAVTPLGLPGDTHPHLLLKTLLLAGLSPSQSFPTAWGSVTLAALVEELKRDFRADAALSSEDAWTLDALSHALPPRASFTSGDGRTVRLDTVMDGALALLERDGAELLAGMKAGAPEVPKRSRGLYAHPCGGLHLVQAVLTHARHPAVRAAWGARLDTQVDVLFYRLASESRQYDAALAATLPAQRLPLLVQMMKFYGHWLETLGRYRDETGWTPTPAQRDAVRQAGALLVGAVRRLDASGAWHDETLRTVSPSLFWDLIGDTCHAARGWQDWRRLLDES